METEKVHSDGPRCYTCDLEIEMRYSLTGPRSKSQGFWSHQDTAEGIAADLEHDALRKSRGPATSRSSPISQQQDRWVNDRAQMRGLHVDTALGDAPLPGAARLLHQMVSN